MISRHPIAPTVSTLLPPDAARDLVLAASTDNTPDDPHRRQKAVERATKRAKAKYPQHFHQE